MSRGHIIIGLGRTLTVDSLMVAQSWISTAYNIMVDDVRPSVLKPHTSNILVKIVGRESISGYPTHYKSKEIEKESCIFKYYTFTQSSGVLLPESQASYISQVLALAFSWITMTFQWTWIPDPLCLMEVCVYVWERESLLWLFLEHLGKPILEVYVMQKYPGANHFSMKNPTTNLKQIF